MVVTASDVLPPLPTGLEAAKQGRNKQSLNPVHVYWITNQFETQILLIEAGYCDGPSQQDIETQHPGWTVTARTWRADWRQLSSPHDCQTDYGS